MQFTKLILAAATIVVVHAKPSFTNAPFSSIAAGSTFNITWTGASGPVTLLLKDGDPTNLQTVESLGSGLTGTSLAWTPSVSLPDGLYAFEIEDSTADPNYSVQFTLTGGAASAAPSSSLTTVPSLSTSTSTSAVSTTTSASQTSSTSKASTTATQQSASPLSSPTSAPKSAAAGLASPLALVFLALAAIVTIN